MGVVVPALLTLPAHAADWTIKAGASENLTLDDNIGMGTVTRDAAIYTSSAFNLDFLATAKTYQMHFSPSLNASRQFFTVTPDTWKVFPTGTFSFTKNTKLTDYAFNATVTRTKATTNDLIDDVIVNQKGDRLAYNFSGSVSHRMTKRDSFSWVNTVNATDYTITSPSLTPYRTYTSQLSWNHTINRLVSGSLNASADLYVPDGVGSKKRRTYRVGAGLNAQLTERLSINASGGLLTIDEQSSPRSSDFYATLAGTYALKDTSFKFVVSRDISPGVNGNLLDRWLMSMNASHQINDNLSTGLVSNYTIQKNATGGHDRAFSISPNLSYQLTRDWSTSVSYRYRRVWQAGEPAYSNAVTFNLAYSSTIMP